MGWMGFVENLQLANLTQTKPQGHFDSILILILCKRSQSQLQSPDSSDIEPRLLAMQTTAHTIKVSHLWRGLV